MSRAQKGMIFFPVIAAVVFAATLLLRTGHDGARAEAPADDVVVDPSQGQIEYLPVTEPEQAPDDIGSPLEQLPPEVQEAVLDDQAALQERKAGVEGEQAEVYARGLENRAILIEAQRAAGVEVLP